MRNIAKTVQRLQALAAGSSGNEAEAAARKARQLMEEHALKQADIEAATGRQEQIVSVRFVFDGLRMVRRSDWEGAPCSWRPRVSHWKRELAQVVGDYLDVESSFVPNHNSWTWHGFESDIETAEALYVICARQINAESKEYLRERKEREPPYPGESKRWTTQFRDSAVQGLQSKLCEMKDASEEALTAERTALMTSRAARVEAYVDENFDFKRVEGFGKDVYCQEGYETGVNLKLREDERLGTGERPMLEAK